MKENLVPDARTYESQLDLLVCEPLGTVKDGIVLVGRRKGQPAAIAIKVLRFDESYLREKQVYERLAKLGISNVIGFHVPQIIDFDDGLRVIEMTVVKRPFVLDFAGAHLDKRPEFPTEVWAEWESEKREQFEGRWPEVQKILDAFEELGIYLLDPSPGNIGFGSPNQNESA
jgi:hypothetical protein